MVLKYDSLKVVIIIVFVIIIDENIYALEERKEKQTVWKYLQRVVTPHKPVELMLSYLPTKFDNSSSQVLKFSLWKFNNESFTIEQNVLTPTSILTNIETTPLIETSTSSDDDKINEFWNNLPNQEYASKPVNIIEPDSSFIEEAIEDFDKYDYLVNEKNATTTTENNNATEEITLLYY